jgi:hypothetical protein
MRELGTAAGECFKIQDVGSRPEFLEASLERINTLLKPPNGNEGLVCENPVGEGGERIIGLVEKEGRVFRSKARTPILVYLEIEATKQDDERESWVKERDDPMKVGKDDGVGVEVRSDERFSRAQNMQLLPQRRKELTAFLYRFAPPAAAELQEDWCFRW